jgi:aldehyde:ferredoxin oxidoreductase
MDIMLGEYYQVRGWENGKVTQEKLRELEIIDPENQLV